MWGLRIEVLSLSREPKSAMAEAYDDQYYEENGEYYEGEEGYDEYYEEYGEEYGEGDYEEGGYEEAEEAEHPTDEFEEHKDKVSLLSTGCLRWRISTF